MYGLCLALFSTSPAWCSDRKGTLSIALENDLFGAGTDKHYTHGTEISYVSDTYVPKWLRSTADVIWFYQSNDETRFSWSLGQKIYTPNEITEPELIVDDRPYAGWTYLSLGLTTNDIEETYRTVASFELIAGIVGPNSGAEDAQIKVHELIGSDIPEGWSNQLDNEWTADLRYRRSWLLPIWQDNIDVIPNLGFTLGSSQRRGGGGFTLRLGSGLASDDGPPLIRPAPSGSNYFKPDQAFYWYFFAGANGEYVDYNIFLDGNRDGESHSVERIAEQGNIQAGLVVGGGNWRLSFTNIYKTREFKDQAEADEFGSISLSYRF
ncbi:lipid A deacylase LpxR family protein [Aurantivibrio plasticivorans]